MERFDRWRAGGTPDRSYFNASAVSFEGKACLIFGAPGSGKSTLALELLAFGAELIADDGVFLNLSTGRLERPDTAPALIEARGVGLLHAPLVPGPRPLACVVDLDRHEAERLPPRRFVAGGPGPVPLILGAGHHSLASTLITFLRHGLFDPDADHAS